MKFKTIMQSQDPDVRINNFEETSFGYSKEQAILEARRCLDCKNAPCVKGCPVEIDIPGFIKAIKNSDLQISKEIISKTSMFPGICGRVCPQEVQCEARCVRKLKGEAVAIGNLERYVSDNYIVEVKESKIDKEKIAIVGSGPGGLACASELIQMGYEVHIFEALHTAGGVLTYGIPEFRLPKKIVSAEVDNLIKMGVKIHLNTVIGKTKKLRSLLNDGFVSVFVGTGAGLPKFMNIEGEFLNGVYSANEFLTRINLMKAYIKDYDTPIKDLKKVAVIGGGNVAMDAARSALRLNNPEVHVIYRRSKSEMPARLEEIEHGLEEGLIFDLLSNPLRIIGDDLGNVKEIECIRMELGEADDKGRRRPVEIVGSNFVIEVDTVIMALGNYPNPLLIKTDPDLSVNKHGCIEVDSNLMTSISGVFAGGDAVTGAATVIEAMGAGRLAAKKMDEYIRSLTKI